MDSRSEPHEATSFLPATNLLHGVTESSRCCRCLAKSFDQPATTPCLRKYDDIATVDWQRTGDPRRSMSLVRRQDGTTVPRPWKGNPHEWLPEYRRILRLSLITLGAGVVLIVGVTCLIWSR